MKICVLGLWHLGTVTAASLAELGHEVFALDFDAAVVADLRAGVPPVFEPGLEELIRSGLSCGRLRFVSRLEEIPPDIEILWVACDTPVDDADVADTNFVMAQIEHALPGMNADTLVLVSSQLPVGSVRRLEQTAGVHGGSRLRVACCPENLRLGRAVEDFLRPRRMVAGVRSERDRELLGRVLRPISQSVEWMSVESAEMTKHAINAFLATSVAFANEIATLCESTGADAVEVARGLKSEPRIGPGAYVSPGAAFAGGTLARDVGFLNQASREHGVSTPLLSAVLPSNELHGLWVRKRLQGVLGALAGRAVAVWGLAYKPGTDTLRRSSAVELCDWLVEQGANVRAHDPMVKDLPLRWSGVVVRCDDPADAVAGADALIVMTEWPVYRAVFAEMSARLTGPLAVLDPNRFLAPAGWRADAAGPASAAGPAQDGRRNLRYLAVGMPAPLQ
jgi:UDPglucose 6-dehydrogenase